MNCNKCGWKINSSLKKCPNCGQVLDNSKEDIVFKECQEGLLDEDESIEEVAAVALESQDKKLENDNDQDEDFYTEAYTKSKGNIFQKILITLLVIIFLAGAAFFTIKYTYNHFINNSSKDYEGKVVEIYGNINNVNNDMANIIIKSSESFNSEAIINALDNTIDLLNAIIADIEKIPVPSSYSDSQINLNEGVLYNKKIYQYMLSVLNNPIGENASTNINSMKDSISKCTNTYAAINIQNLTFSLPDEILKTESIITPWVEKKNNEYSQVSSLIDSFAVYFDKMSSIIINYENSKIDLTQEIKNARDNKAYNNLLALIDKCERDVKSAKTDYSKLTIPSYLKTFNSQFSIILDDTLSYYSKLRLAIAQERYFKKDGLNEAQLKKALDDINNMYDDAEKTNTSTMQNYKKFATDFKNTKDNYLNPTFVYELKFGK